MNWTLLIETFSPISKQFLSLRLQAKRAKLASTVNRNNNACGLSLAVDGCFEDVDDGDMEQEDSLREGGGGYERLEGEEDTREGNP